MPILRLDTAELATRVKNFSKRSKMFHADMHQLAISVLFHAAEHGECTPLNSFFNDALPVSYQTSFKLFVKRCMDERGYATGEWLKFKGGLFSVMTGTTDERDAFMMLAEEELIDGKPFFDYDPIKEDKIFNAAEVLKLLSNLVKKASKDDAEVPADVIAALKAAEVDVARAAGVQLVH